ncbi:DUF3987 domain-containing protein, partial [Bacteroides reticulotermitis]|uniref:DUF3987 domain-containing protein n=1 Tax=Bacteroides reticulotermitis TaxID=1133319 RepID=UPI003A8373E1
ESYRKLKNRPDRENEAGMTKDSLPVVIIEGTCRPHRSHAAANLERLSGLAMYDLDHTGQRTAEIKNMLRSLPYVAYTHTSISGEGLKIVIYLDVRTVEEYPTAYAICRRMLEVLANHPCDGQCARITQPCSCVWDPDAYFTPTPQPYPWRAELAANPSLASLAAPSALPGDGNANGSLSGKGNGKVSPIPPTTDACGYIEAFIRTFASYHPWQKGNRHESMLALGRSARRKGFSKEELNKLTLIMAVEIVGNGYTQKELEKDLLTGYQYVNLSYIPPKEGKSLPLVPTATFRPISNEILGEDTEEMSINNEEIRASSPTIPNEVYTHLPDFLKEALKPARNNRERDILLLGILVNLSGCMPNVRIYFDQRPYSPHLYLLIIAPPASGKGILTLAGMLPEAVNAHLKRENKRKKDAYEQELKAWEESSKQHTKKGQHPSGTPPASMPEEPDYYYLCGAPNTSKNQLISRLKINGDLGLIINASELDMISGAMKQEYGRHDDVFRAAFHHEPVSTDYKIDKQIICAEEPHLALCLSGTPNQLPSFIRSIDNGLYSRFEIYTCEARWKFRSAAPIGGGEDYVTLYKRLSQQVLDMYLLFLQSPTEVTLTPSQWEEHTVYFDRLLNEVASEQADAPGSIVLRAALIVARIAAVLTAIRKTESAMRMKEFICTDEDFHSAMEIVKTTINHSLLLISSLPGDEVKPKPLKSYFRIRSVLDLLPKNFTYKEVRDKAIEMGIPERSTCRYLKKLLELNYLEKQEDSYIKLKEITDR